MALSDAAVNGGSIRRDRLAAAAGATPAFVAVAVFAWWARHDGGFTTTTLNPGGLVVLAAFLTLVVARPGSIRAGRPLAVALGALLAFTAVSYFSILWSDAPGDAWGGANRTLVYAAVFALFALAPLTPAAGAAALGTFAMVAAVTGLEVVAKAADGTDVAHVFVDGRLSQPIGYVNGSAAFFTSASLAALVLASRRELQVPARAVLLGTATALLDLALLAQSRAWLVFLPLALVATFALAPGKVRLLLTILPVAAAFVASLPVLLDVYRAFEHPGRVAAIRDARDAILVGAAATGLVGAAAALVDRRLEFPEALARRADRWLTAAAGAAALVGALAVLVAVGDPLARVADAWDEFRSGYPREFSGSHFAGGGLGDYRADQWRVAVDTFTESPLLGAGADGFAAHYIAERRTDNEARYPHSVELSVLAETGLLGAIPFAAFLAAVAAAASGAFRRTSPFRRAVAAAALAAAAYWLLHGSVDWFWELPGVSAPAFAALGLAAGLGARGEASLRGISLAAGAGVAVVAAAAALAVPWFAAAETERAARAWRADPDRALELLDRAGRVNPLAAQPALLAGAIANRSGRPERAVDELREALRREPRNWYAHLELALAQAQLGRRDAALRSLSEAATLNPREPVVREVRRELAGGEPVDLAELDAVFRQRVESRTR